jgi:Na+(H+)/acetate symporter ActP
MVLSTSTNCPVLLYAMYSSRIRKRSAWSVLLLCKIFLYVPNSKEISDQEYQISEVLLVEMKASASFVAHLMRQRLQFFG